MQTFFNDTVPAACNDMVLRTRDSITKYTAPARVFRWGQGEQPHAAVDCQAQAVTRDPLDAVLKLCHVSS